MGSAPPALPLVHSGPSDFPVVSQSCRRAFALAASPPTVSFPAPAWLPPVFLIFAHLSPDHSV